MAGKQSVKPVKVTVTKVTEYIDENAAPIESDVDDELDDVDCEDGEGDDGEEEKKPARRR